MSEVQKFYDGKCLLITGVTGFVGKFLLLKILRSCNPSCVYVLIRKKKGLSSEQRLKLFLEREPVFKFQPLDPGMASKVIAIDGDIGVGDIFSRKEDLHRILNQVQVVIHSAADVRFNEAFEHAFKANAGGTANILNLCRSLNKLVSFVYVSTYATQVHRDSIREHVDSMIPGMEDEIRLKGISDHSWMIDFCRPHAEDAPNTYTLTKNIAEVMVQVVSQQEGFPTVILRPPSLCAPAREPEIGFADDPRQGLISLALSVYLGVIVMIVLDGSKRFVYNTADVIANAILVSAFDVTRNHSEGSSSLLVMNACKEGETFDELFEGIVTSGKKYPSLSTLRPLHHFKCTTDGVVTRVKKLFYHYAFAVLVDLSLLLTGKKMMMFSSICKLERMQGMGAKILFLTDCKLESSHFSQMRSRLSAKDSELFYLDSPGLSQNYLDRCCLSFRKHILKEGEETLAKARQQLQRKAIAILVVKAALLMLVLYLVIGVFK